MGIEIGAGASISFSLSWKRCSKDELGTDLLLAAWLDSEHFLIKSIAFASARGNTSCIFLTFGSGRESSRLRQRRLDRRDVLSRRLACNLENFIELVHGRATGEDGLASEHLTQNASDRPDVDGLGIARGTK